MATLTPVIFSAEPTALDIAASAVAAASGGDEFVNVAKTGFWIANASGGPETVTFDAPSTCNFDATHDAAVVVPDGFAGFIAHKLLASRFNDADGKVQVTYSSETGLTVAAVVFAD